MKKPIFFSLILFLVSCASIGADTQTPTVFPKEMSTESPALQPTSTPITKTARTPTLTKTPTATVFPTATNRPTITQTVMPTISAPPGLLYCAQGELWAIKQDRGHQLMAPDCDIQIAPDYQWAFYEDRGAVWIINLETAEIDILVDLTEQVGQPKYFHGAQWSPDSNSVYYLESDDGWLTDIWVIGITARAKRNLANTPDRIEWNLEYWPGPDKLVFSSFQQDEDIRFGYIGHLTEMHPSGEMYQILSDEMLSIPPLISPDGETLALLGGELFHWNTGFETIDFEIADASPPEKVGLELPAWSPDSTRIAWSLHVVQNGKFLSGVGVLDLMDNSLRLLHLFPISMGEGFPPPPIWSPNGEWLALQAYDADEERAGIWALKVDGSEEHYLGNFYDPIWSRDSHWLGFNNLYEEDGSGIWVAENGNWQSTQTDLPPGAEVKGWAEITRIENWRGLIPFTSGHLYIITEAGDNLNVRESPSLNAEVVHQLKAGDIVTLLDDPYIDYEDLETKLTWLKIQDTKTNIIGWTVVNHTWYAPVDE